MFQLDSNEVRPDLARWRKFSIAAGTFAGVVGILVLAGWLVDDPRLKGSYQGITMKANAALCFLLTGFSLFVLNNEKLRRTIRRSGIIAAAVVTLIAVLTLFEHVAGWDLRIDQLLFVERPGEPGTSSPGRMGPNGAVCFTLCGLALLALYSGRHKRAATAQTMAAAVMLIALVPTVGYAYHAEELFGISRYTGIALPTALSLVILALGLLSA